MSGEQKSANEKAKDVNAYLDRFEFDNKIVPIQRPEDESEISKIINLSPDLINKLTPDQCWEYAIRLSQYASYIQRMMNKEKTTEKWANGAIYDSAAKEFDQYKFMSEDAKIAIIAETNNYVAELLRIKRASILKISRIEYFSHALKDQANLFIMIKKNKERIDV